MHALDSRVLETMLDDLTRQGWAASPQLLMQPLCEALYVAALEHKAEGEFRPAGVGQGAQSQSSIRGDAIRWLSLDSACPAEQAFLTAMHALVRTMKSAFLLSLNAYEAHFACYEAGQFYRRHLDRFQGENSREFSTLLYLNPDWKASDGGALVIHPDQVDAQPVSIVPELGTFVIFRSGMLLHEVEPPLKTRFSIAGWMKKDDPMQANLNGTLIPES